MKIKFILDSNETLTPIQIAQGISDGVEMECLIDVVEFLELIIKQEKRRLECAVSAERWEE